MEITRGLRLETADQADVHRIASWVTSEADVLTFAGPSLTYPFTAAEFFESTAGRRESFVLRAGSAAVATGALEDRRPGEVRIGRVLVDPGQRGQGLGRAMMQLLIKRAAARPGVRRLTLGVFEGNRPARVLYESLGFADTGGRVPIQVGQQIWTSLEMKRELVGNLP
ncbi:MAG: GNAT family N-acetyltransferase [Micrococcus sp.]|nr:GNAT family N-acetyltransferase [Micrococcus sp.]